MDNQEQDPRITAPVPRQWRRLNPLPQPVVVVNTFNEAEYDQQLVALNAVTADIRDRIRTQTNRIDNMDAFFQTLIPRIRHVLSEMLASHNRDIEQMAAVFNAALTIAQTERDRIAVRARASMAQAHTLTRMQQDYLDRLDQYIETLDEQTARRLRLLLEDDDGMRGSPPPNYPSDGESSPGTITSYATVDDERLFLNAWNKVMQEARERSADIGAIQFLRNQLTLFNREDGGAEQREAEFLAVLRSITAVYNVPETNENIEILIRGTPREVLGGGCNNDLFRDHPNGLIIRDERDVCQDLIAFAESVASRGGRAGFITRAANIVMGYSLFTRLLAGPNNEHARYEFADAILRQYQLPLTRSNNR